MTIVARVTVLLAPALALPLSFTAVHAQAPRPSRVPEPWLHETPWGDFPLERVERGSRLRFTHAGGRRVEVQVLALRDSTLELQSEAGEPLAPVTFADLRSLEMVEVRAIPRWRSKAETIGMVAGAVIGAVIGHARHRNPPGPPKEGEHQPSRFEDVASHAGAGGFFGWMTARLAFGRPRWRPVTLP